WMFAAIGIMGSAFGVAVVLAYQNATASELAPYGYAELATAALLGWLIFDQLPDTFTWIGMAVIVASGLTIAWRETVRHPGRRYGALRKTSLR
ncbi:MAG: EamA/RhaT family transporter, partial [Pseudomonadota bacterium]